MPSLIMPKTSEGLYALLKELPVGALKSWGRLEGLANTSHDPIYMLIVNKPDDNPVLQFKDPAELLVGAEDIYYHVTKERVAQKEYFNMGAPPTFMIFDNYLHLKAFELKLKAVGHTLHYRQFE